MEPVGLSNLGIAAVERETGLSRDVLRKWETRYGFPTPLRDALGERLYPEAQVIRLRLIKRLMDAGMRPSRVVHLDMTALASLARDGKPARRGAVAQEGAASLDLLREHDPEGLRQRLNRLLLRQGVENFVLSTLAPLTLAVGEAWARGDLGVHEEHLYTEVVQGVLRNIIAEFSDSAGSPRVLLATLPEERHGLGILMVASLFSLHGAYCLSLGPQTPVFDIALAARMHDVDLVALSFSAAYPRGRIARALDELSQQTGGRVGIWAGGAGVARLDSTPSGAVFLHTLEQGLEALRGWRERECE